MAAAAAPNSNTMGGAGTGVPLLPCELDEGKPLELDVLPDVELLVLVEELVDDVLVLTLPVLPPELVAPLDVLDDDEVELDEEELEEPLAPLDPVLVAPFEEDELLLELLDDELEEELEEPLAPLEPVLPPVLVAPLEDPWPPELA